MRDARKIKKYFPIDKRQAIGKIFCMGLEIYNLKAVAYAKRRKAKKDGKVFKKPKPAILKTPKQIVYQNDRPMYRKGMKADFYRTREWFDLRYKAILKYGRVCACCKSKEGPHHVDHVKPRSKYPSLELELRNLQVLCEACNIGKSNTDETDWREG